MNLKSILALARTPHLATQGQLRRDLEAYVRVSFLSAAFDSGLLGALKTPSTLVELVSKLQPQRSELLEALIRVGVTLSELAAEHGRYKICGSRARALVEHHAGSSAAVYGINTGFGALADLLLQGGTRIEAGEGSPEMLSQHGFRLTLTGEFGAAYEIFGSTDWSSWTPLGTVTNTWGTVQFTDPEAATTAHRAYRARAVE